MTTQSSVVAHSQAMFAGVDASFRRVLLSEAARDHLATALGTIDLDNVSPLAKDIFGFARYGRLDDVKVVIIGQDPYLDKRHAHGLSFSSLDSKIPPSLLAIYDCLEQSGFLLPGWRTTHPERPADLGIWARQGVLMLNIALTTFGKAGAHLSTWAPYTKCILAAIGAISRPMVFMLWGGKAQELQNLITNPHALILTETHPSPLSQNALPEARRFKHCKHFVEANTFLVAAGLTGIDWRPWPAPSNDAGQLAPSAESKEEIAPRPRVNAVEKHIMFTDGSASANGSTSGKAGYATWFTSGSLAGTRLTGRLAPVRVALPGAEDKMLWPTNIRAEGFAIVMGLEHVLEHCASTRPVVEVVTDSKFWIQMLEIFIPNWIASKVTFESKENPDLVKRIWTVAQAVRAAGTLELRHVYSHGKDKTIAPADRAGNDLCDQWALAARNAPDFFDKVERLDAEGQAYSASD